MTEGWPTRAGQPFTRISWKAEIGRNVNGIKSGTCGSSEKKMRKTQSICRSSPEIGTERIEEIEDGRMMTWRGMLLRLVETAG